MAAPLPYNTVFCVRKNSILLRQMLEGRTTHINSLKLGHLLSKCRSLYISVSVMPMYDTTTHTAVTHSKFRPRLQKLELLACREYKIGGVTETGES